MKTPHTLRILNSSKSLEVKQKRCELGQWEAQLVKMLAVQAQWPVWCLAPCKGGREELTLKSCPLASINALWHCLSHKQNSRRTVGLCGTVTCLGSCSWKQRGVEDEKVSSQQTHGGGGGRGVIALQSGSRRCLPNAIPNRQWSWRQRREVWTKQKWQGIAESWLTQKARQFCKLWLRFTGS